MLLLVGLGNPGPRYADNRHNIGFMALDAIARRHGFSPWRRRFDGEVAEGELDGERILALKPMTFMNDSGRSVGQAARFYKIPPEQVLVLHDELDLAPGKVKLKSGGGHAGHNGLRSIIDHIGPAFRRLRLGIGHPGHKDRVHGYVLSDFAKAEHDWLERLFDALAAQAGLLVHADDKTAGTFMSKVNQATLAPKKDAKPHPTTKPASIKPATPAGGMTGSGEGPLAEALRRVTRKLRGGDNKTES
jgi:PTH1 family peptidyl-tRNA hydrolase